MDGPAKLGRCERAVGFHSGGARIKLHPSVGRSDRELVLRLFHPLGDEQNFHSPFGPCALASAFSRVGRMEGDKMEDGRSEE